MTSILFVMLKEIFLGMLGKVAGKAIMERFATRLVIHGLNKLKDYSTNDVVDDTVQDVIDKLKGKKLKVIEDE